MKTILITGALGYTGSVLVERLLKEGYNLILLDNLMYQQHTPFLCSHQNVVFIKGNIGDYELLSSIKSKYDIDCVIHLAAIVGASACDSDMDSWNINVNYALDLFYLFDDIPVVLPNSNSQYGTVDGVCTEETPIKPLSKYAEQKCEVEHYLVERGNYISLRLATVFGISHRMRLDLLVNDLIYRSLTDGYINLYGPHANRNFLHVRDLAECYVECIQNFDELKNEIYNVGNDNLNRSKIELCDEIKKYVPDFRYTIDCTKSDPDKRDYKVSSEKFFNRINFKPKHDIKYAIDEFKRVLPMLRMPYRNT